MKHLTIHAVDLPKVNIFIYIGFEPYGHQNRILRGVPFVVISFFLWNAQNNIVKKIVNNIYNT